MSEIILTSVKCGIFKSEDKTIVVDINVYNDALVLKTRRGKYVLKQDGVPSYPSYSTFYSGGVLLNGVAFHVQVEIMKRTAILSW